MAHHAKPLGGGTVDFFHAMSLQTEKNYKFLILCGGAASASGDPKPTASCTGGVRVDGTYDHMEHYGAHAGFVTAYYKDVPAGSTATVNATKAAIFGIY